MCVFLWKLKRLQIWRPGNFFVRSGHVAFEKVAHVALCILISLVLLFGAMDFAENFVWDIPSEHVLDIQVTFAPILGALLLYQLFHL